jgi:hypothetical protein
MAIAPIHLTLEASMFRRKVLGSAVFVPLIIGSVGLMNLMHQPRFETYRTVDVVQLLGTGLCYGVALVALIMLLCGPRGS